MKRQLTTLLAKEDIKRFKRGECSIASEILENPNLKSMASIIVNKCSRKGRPDEECLHVRTTDAWMRKFQTVTVAELTKAVELYVHSDLENEETTPMESQESQAKETKNLESEHFQQSNPSVVSRAYTKTPSDISLSESNKLFDEVSPPSEVSLSDRKRSKAPSDVSRAESTHSKAPSDVSRAESKRFEVLTDVAPSIEKSERRRSKAPSEVSHAESKLSKVPSDLSRAEYLNMKSTKASSVVSRAESKALSAVSEIRPTPSVVSRAESIKEPEPDPWKDDAKSAISISDKKSFISLAQSAIAEETEDDIQKWYETSLASLQLTAQRVEQYRRKKALLRVEYWTKMDKLKNNATPTVINF